MYFFAVIVQILLWEKKFYCCELFILKLKGIENCPVKEVKKSILGAKNFQFLLRQIFLSKFERTITKWSCFSWIYMICPTIKSVKKLTADAESKWHVTCPTIMTFSVSQWLNCYISAQKFPNKIKEFPQEISMIKDK